MHLARLRIENLALVDKLDVEFEPVMIAITGETGAGKSMILGSLALLLGARADAGLVRKGAAKASVEAVVELGGTSTRHSKALMGALAAMGIEHEDGEPLILRRELSETGRSIAQVAGRLVTVRQMAELGGLLIDVHSQHDQQSLTQRRWQRDTLDTFAGALDLADKVRDTHQRWRTAQAEYDEWLVRERELRRQEDLLRFQCEEIGKAQLRTDEEQHLLQRETMLANSEGLRETVSNALAFLDDEEHGAVARMRLAQRELQRLVQLDAQTADWSASLVGAMQLVDELGREWAAYLERLEVDPGELDRVQDRLHLVSQLKRKYGDSVQAVIEYGAKAEEDLQRIGSFEERLGALKVAADGQHGELRTMAAKLGEKRKAAAAKLSAHIEKELAHLGMHETKFVVALEPCAEIGATGMEDVEFRIAVNRGEDAKPLSKVASGGELSRITLALKCIATRGDDVPVLVFDEIDAGIGGTVAHAVGERVQKLGTDHQVFVITHLPQIASRAEAHFAVNKAAAGDRTMVSIVALSTTEREKELARMLGGESKTALAHARELVGRAGNTTKRK